MSAYPSLSLAKVGRTVCVVWRERDMDEPVINCTYYPSDLDSELTDAELSGATVVSDSWPGVYSVKLSPHGYWVRCNLTNYGKTLPIKFEREPVPRPKSRCKLRWYRGEWQKETRRGYVAV